MITKKDILDALGGRDTEDRFLFGVLCGVGVGALVGTVVTLLLAPKSGTETRQMIGEKVGNLRHRGEREISS
jgi:gas vesicle protein